MEDPPGELNSERQWIEDAKKDISSFRPLYDKYVDAVYRYFVRRTDSETLAEELCSTTFFKALDNLQRFQWQGKPFGAWLFRIAANELHKYFRNRKPVYVIEEEKLDCLEMEHEVLADYMPELIQALDELSEKELHILELKFFEGLEFKEISQLLGIGESAAKMRVYRLLDKLKIRIKESYDKA